MHDTTLKKNYAKRAGGACFVENINVLNTDCKLEAAVPVQELKGHRSNNFKCSSMVGNSVGVGGSGDNIATFQTGFYARLSSPNANPRNVERGSAEFIQNLHSGDVFPRLRVFTIDWFHQGPPVAETRNHRQTVDTISNQLMMTELL